MPAPGGPRVHLLVLAGSTRARVCVSSKSRVFQGAQAVLMRLIHSRHLHCTPGGACASHHACSSRICMPLAAVDTQMNTTLNWRLSVRCPGATLWCTAKSLTSTNAGRRHSPSARHSLLTAHLKARSRPQCAVVCGAAAVPPPPPAPLRRPGLPTLDCRACGRSPPRRLPRYAPVGKKRHQQGQVLVIIKAGAFYSISSSRLPSRGPVLFTYSTRLPSTHFVLCGASVVEA